MEAISRELLISACQLHEIGLSVDFKQAPQHAAYLVRNLDLPGFTPHRKTVSHAVTQPNQPGRSLFAPPAKRGAAAYCGTSCRLLRLAIIFASRRRDDLVPEIHLEAKNEHLTITLPEGWLVHHPLGKELIDQESQWQSYVHWPLEVH